MKEKELTEMQQEYLKEFTILLSPFHMKLKYNYGSDKDKIRFILKSLILCFYRVDMNLSKEDQNKELNLLIKELEEYIEYGKCL